MQSGRMFWAAPAGHDDAGLYLHLLAFGIAGKCKLAFISMLVCVYAQIAHKKILQVVVYAKIFFASLRLRKNLVELRARLSLLVDKTTFQYRALTIYYTTIGRHAPAITTTTTSASSRGGKGPHWTRPDQPPRPPCAEEGGDTTDALGSPLAAAATEGWDAPGSAHRHPRRGGGGALCRIIHSASTPQRKGRPRPSGSPPPAPARRDGSGRPGRAGSSPSTRSHGGAK